MGTGSRRVRCVARCAGGREIPFQDARWRVRAVRVHPRREELREPFTYQARWCNSCLTSRKTIRPKLPATLIPGDTVSPAARLWEMNGEVDDESLSVLYSCFSIPRPKPTRERP